MCALTSCYSSDEVHPCIKDIAATLLLVELQKVNLRERYPELKPLVDVAQYCLEIDCGKRLMASEIYRSLHGNVNY